MIDVAPGERYDLAFTATEPGKWVFHCHIGHHLTNNGDSPGGLLMIVNVGGKTMTSASGTSGDTSGGHTMTGAGGNAGMSGDMSGMPGMTMTSP